MKSQVFWVPIQRGEDNRPPPKFADRPRRQTSEGAIYTAINKSSPQGRKMAADLRAQRHAQRRLPAVSDILNYLMKRFG